MNDSTEIPPNRDDRNPPHQFAVPAPEDVFTLGGEGVTFGPIGRGRTVLNPLLGLHSTDEHRAALPSVQRGKTPDGHSPSEWFTGELGHGKGFGIKRLPINRHSDGKDHR